MQAMLWKRRIKKAKKGVLTMKAWNIIGLISIGFVPGFVSGVVLAILFVF
jgi:hypothetical protein